MAVSTDRLLQLCDALSLSVRLLRAVADPERLSRGGRNPWRAREARAYNGGLGAEPPEAESFSVLRRRNETANLPLSCVLGSGLAYCT